MSIFRLIHSQHWYPNYQMSIFRSIHLQHWYPNYQMSILRSIHLQHWYPKYQMSTFRSIHLQHWYPNVNIWVGSIRNPFGWGRNPNIIYLAGAAIRTRNHNYEDRNYDLNAHPHMLFLQDQFLSLKKVSEISCLCKKSVFP